MASSVRTRRLALGFFGLAGVTYGLIVLGALVRAHGAGLACPDWPLCFGEVIPAFDFQVAFEWGHRALAGSVGLVFLALATVIALDPALRRRMGARLGLAALLLGVQIVLGGLTVLELLASWTVTSHLVTGNAFALCLVLVARRLWRLAREEAGETPAAEPAGAGAVERGATTAAAALLAIQLVLGGLVSSQYAGLICPEWPACMNGEFIPTLRGIQGLHVWHRLTGYSVVAAVLLAAWLSRGHPQLRRWLGVASGLALAQVGVGVAKRAPAAAGRGDCDAFGAGRCPRLLPRRRDA